MTKNSEPVDRALAGLTTLEPDAVRAARTRQRCREMLERRAHPGASSAVRHPRWGPIAAKTAARRTMVGAYCVLCVLYVLALILTTVGLQGVVR